MASFPKTKTTNQELFDIISQLKKYSTKTGVGTFKAVAAKLAGPASQRAQVNLSKIDKVVKAGETIIVPGKVLGDGQLSKKVNIIAYSISSSALDKLKSSQSTYTSINDYLSKNPKDKPRIIG